MAPQAAKALQTRNYSSTIAGWLFAQHVTIKTICAHREESGSKKKISLGKGHLQPRKVDSSVQMQTGGAANLRQVFDIDCLVGAHIHFLIGFLVHVRSALEKYGHHCHHDDHPTAGCRVVSIIKICQKLGQHEIKRATAK